MQIPLEKILTISAQAYVGPTKNVRDEYEVKGVHWKGVIGSQSKTDQELTGFGEVPENTEVVVNYHYQTIITNGSLFYRPVIMFQMSGTALIPKKK